MYQTIFRRHWSIFYCRDPRSRSICIENRVQTEAMRIVIGCTKLKTLVYNVFILLNRNDRRKNINDVQDDEQWYPRVYKYPGTKCAVRLPQPFYASITQLIIFLLFLPTRLASFSYIIILFHYCIYLCKTNVLEHANSLWCITVALIIIDVLI